MGFGVTSRPDYVHEHPDAEIVQLDKVELLAKLFETAASFWLVLGELRVRLHGIKTITGTSR